MKVKTLKRFRDKETKAIHEVGETFEATAERVKEILSVGKYVEEVAAEKAEAVEETETEKVEVKVVEEVAAKPARKGKKKATK